ncbi:sensor histidine kinase [Klenkia taihuensis]|uniref:histidine kinase n=1 Tax=Klenkia taihuensis TaxID=1225127 RepID=A0A1I1PBI0_9ACTN|nr:sensor histidine kinase [Klenkia taihuensis]GHE11479.1 two-component sensor histidine kinase [Klenkia taihuensis]SFD04373.1 Signal transduction histidine kinase [Klenkia taihuensis]
MDETAPLSRTGDALRAHPFAVDVGIAVLVGLATVALGGSGVEGPGDVLVSIGLVAPLAWRRTAPVPAAAVVVVVGLAQVALTSSFVAANVAVPMMVYALAAYAPRWASRAGLAFGLVGAVIASLRYFGGFYYGDASFSYGRGLFDLVITAGAIGVLVVACWAIGTVKRGRIQREAAMLERAQLLELERDQEMRLAATTERARIAREMHDVVAHSLSVVIAQADGGRYAGRADPEAAVGALEQISATGRQALADMRALLGVLREDGGQEFAPQPDVAAVPALVEDVRRSGLDIDLLVEGEPRDLPTGSQLAAYRIVQESLTNVLKHAGPASRAWVRLQWRADALELSVLDDGRGAAAAIVDAEGRDGRGQGLTGMRERAQLHGGRLEAGPRHGGGFGVHAVLPYGRRR